MALIEHDLFRGRIDKVQMAIDRIRAFSPRNIPYYGAFSGGKDSVTIKRLGEMAGLNIEWHYNVTTVDPPELVWFVKKHHPDVKFNRPKKTMWQIIEEHGAPPIRTRRFCCEDLKECYGGGRTVLTGIRWQESRKRKERQIVEPCYKDETKRYVHPIIDWTTAEVWQFIRQERVPYCGLYDEGFKRLGCVLCPYSTYRKIEAQRWQKLTALWERSVKATWRPIKSDGKKNPFPTPEALWQWWLLGRGKFEDGGLFA